MIDTTSHITIFGATGLLGGAVFRQLEKQDYTHLQPMSSKDLDLTDKIAVDNYFQHTTPTVVFMTAGLVGGIVGNKKRGADFLYQNTMMILNVLEAVKNHSPTTKIIYTGSTCIYPKENPQPINEDRFLSGSLEQSNIGYTMAKSTGIVACQLYKTQYNINTICAMPTNLYGIGDNYDLENGHMLAALIKKFITAKDNNTELNFWGTGSPRREALYSDDCADALIYLMNHYNKSDIINIGTGFDNSIKEYIEILEQELQYTNTITWDETKPDGTFEKRTDISRLLEIYPNYKPRTFLEGFRAITSNKHEMERIRSDI